VRDFEGHMIDGPCCIVRGSGGALSPRGDRSEGGENRRVFVGPQRKEVWGSENVCPRGITSKLTNLVEAFREEKGRRGDASSTNKHGRTVTNLAREEHERSCSNVTRSATPGGEGLEEGKKD